MGSNKSRFVIRAVHLPLSANSTETLHILRNGSNFSFPPADTFCTRATENKEEEEGTRSIDGQEPALSYWFHGLFAYPRFESAISAALR
jgi:hypothetical protein